MSECWFETTLEKIFDCLNARLRQLTQHPLQNQTPQEMEALKDLAGTLGFPGVEKLFRAAERRGIAVTRPQVAAFVRAQGQRQVLAPRPKYEGKIVATRINDRWTADLIDYTARPSEEKTSSSLNPYQYVLIVQDIFSRKIWAVAMRVKDTQTVREAFEHIVRSGAGTPRELDTDNGLEFRGVFEHYLEEENIGHTIADSRNKNARGTLDAAIKVFKQQLARIQIAEHRRDWAALVPRAVAAYNDTVHYALIGRAPDDVSSDNDLKFLLTERAAEGIQKNQSLIQARAAALQRLGGFRNELGHQPRGFERSFKPRYGDDVHIVSKIIKNRVYSETGEGFPTRHVLPVPGHTEAVSTAGMHGGSDQTDRLRLQTLEPYKDRISNFLGDEGKPEFEVANYMKEIGMDKLMVQGLNYRKALRLLGFEVHGNARGSGKQLVTRPPHPAAAAPAAPAPRMSAAMAASLHLLGPVPRPAVAPAAAAAALAVRRRRGFKSAP